MILYVWSVTSSRISRRMPVTRSSRLSKETWGENTRNSAGKSSRSPDNQMVSARVRRRRMIVEAHVIMSARIGSPAAASNGSTAMPNRKVGVVWASGTTSRIRAVEISGSNLKEPVTLKTSGRSETPRTDLKPSPKRPISLLRFIEMWLDKSDSMPSMSSASPSFAQ